MGKYDELRNAREYGLHRRGRQQGFAEAATFLQTWLDEDPELSPKMLIRYLREYIKLDKATDTAIERAIDDSVKASAQEVTTTGDPSSALARLISVCEDIRKRAEGGE